MVATSTIQRLSTLVAGQQIPYGGDSVAVVPAALADAFVGGDHLVVLQDTGDLLHVPAAVQTLVAAAVASAVDGFAGLATCTDDQISAFFDHFAARLGDDEVFAAIAAANAADVATAGAAGRSTTRLVLTPGMRADMIDGLRSWRDMDLGRDVVERVIEHDRWRVEARRAPLGAIGFVFEGRPNVFADATGVLRAGNSVVFRIGSDALGTARAIVAGALQPALAKAGLPAGAVTLVDSPARAAGWALMGDRRLALAVARGSGTAVAQLGAVARQAGVPVSLHGTGGAWVVAAASADAERFAAVVEHSLDRKVCNSLNVCCIVRGRAAELMPVLVRAATAAAARRSTVPVFHVERGSVADFPTELFDTEVTVRRADGDHRQRAATVIERDQLGDEWEWESSPELSVVVVDDVDQAIALCNRYSPHFIASLVSDEAAEHEHFYAAVDAPFVGDGFTRWVDGQYALGTPELGLSNWQWGRLLARSGVLSGDSVYTVRYRAHVADPGLHR